MVEIKPGYELDRAVAEAIGLKATHKVLGGGYYFVRPCDEMEAFPVKFAPSVDLNAAFFAAEKSAFANCEGLFTDWQLCRRANAPKRTGWVIECDGCPATSLYPTPALAICAAILELAKAK